MVNKPFLHISDFVLASYTFGCVKMYDFVPDGDFDVDDRPREGRPKTFEDADVIYYELLKPNETITGERYRKQLMRLSRELCKKTATTRAEARKSDSTA